MLHGNQRIDSLLYNFETTYRSDYRFGTKKEYPKTVYKEKPSRYKREEVLYKDVYSMTPWMDKPPFNLLHKPKDIVRTNPNVVQQRFEKLIRKDNEAQKTRPRLVMTPAVSMDDIEDPRARHILCTDMYTSSMSKAIREAVTPYSNVKAALPGRPAPSNVISLPKLQPPFVSPEWRRDTVKWDGNQLRSYCNPTREFWLRRKLSWTDYRDGEILPISKTVYKAKPICYRIRPPPLKDIHTLTEWKTPNVPFSLLHKSKDIVRTNPWEIQKAYEKSSDLGWEEAKKTRPRLVMTPAVSMDDISAPETRKLLVDDIYVTTAQRALRDGVPDMYGVNIRAALPGKLAPANPITLEKLHPSYVSPEWRMESVSWDGRQLRGHCNPDKEFYLAITPKCSACDVTARLEAERKLAKQMKKQ